MVYGDFIRHCYRHELRLRTYCERSVSESPFVQGRLTRQQRTIDVVNSRVNRV